MIYRTYSIKHREIDKKWVLIDAKNLVVGRLASIIANLLRGKHKATFTPHMDCGDNVVVVNASLMKLTGNKRNPKNGKTYYKHTGHPGGIKEVTAGRMMEDGKPEFVLTKAVERMITRHALGREQMTHLYIYANDQHKHQAQSPQFLDVAALNKKNVRN